MTTEDDNSKPLVLRDPVSHRIKQGSAALNPKGRPVENWRQYLRAHTNNGEMVWQILLQLAEGKERTVQMKDGREATIIPTPEVQVRAAIHLSEMLFGKAVTQNEQMKAEREASDMEAVRALSQEQLEERARAALTRAKVAVEEDAVLLEEGVDAAQALQEMVRGGAGTGWAYRVWLSEPVDWLGGEGG